MVKHHRRRDDLDLGEVLMIEFEDKDEEFLASLAAVAEIAIATNPRKYPELSRLSLVVDAA
jgi:hypothetical protein